MARYRSLLEAESTADESEAESPIAGEGGTDTHKGRADKSGGEAMEKGGANLDAKDKKAEEQPDIAKKKDADAGTGKHHPSTSPEDVKDIKESDDAEEDDDEYDISEEDDDDEDDISEDDDEDKVDGKKAVDEMFADDRLSEDFKAKATVVFEAAVGSKLVEEVARIEKEYEAKLDEQTELAVADLVEKVDSYLDYVVEQWMTENELAIEKGIRSEIAESFIDGLRGLFVEHNINIPEEDVDVIADITEQLEETEAALNEAMDRQIKLRKELHESKRQDAFAGVAEGLTFTQVEKLTSLTEGLEYRNLADFTRKVEIIKENYFSTSTKTSLTEEVDPVDEGTQRVATDSSVAKYAEAISRTLR
jgi:hypothetical protein